MKEEKTNVDFSNELNPAINKLLTKIEIAPTFGYERSRIVRTFIEKTHDYLNKKDKDAIVELLK